MHIHARFRPLAAAVLVATLAGSLTGALAYPDMPDDGLKMTELGKVGTWTLNRADAEADGALAWCEALSFTTTALRYEHGPATRSFGFSAYASASTMEPFDVELWWDDNRAASAVLSMTSEHGNGTLWRTYRVAVGAPDGIMDNLRTAKTVHFSYKVPGEADREVSASLAGAPEAMDKAIACAK